MKSNKNRKSNLQVICEKMRIRVRISSLAVRLTMHIYETQPCETQYREYKARQPIVMQSKTSNSLKHSLNYRLRFRSDDRFFLGNELGIRLFGRWYQRYPRWRVSRGGARMPVHVFSPLERRRQIYDVPSLFLELDGRLTFPDRFTASRPQAVDGMPIS